MIPELRSGGLVRLHGRAGRRLAWALPAWAVACGALASGALSFSPSVLLRLALILLLVEAGWGTLWGALATTDWAGPLRRWRHWRLGDSLPLLPYAQPDSPAYRFARWLGQLRAWGETVFLPVAGRGLGAATAGLLLSLLVAAAIGPGVVLLTLAAVALMELAVVLDDGQGHPASAWDGVTRLGLPWLVGHLAFAPATLPSLVAAAAFALAVAGRGPGTWIAGQAVAALLFLPLHQPLMVLLLAFLLFPQWLLMVWAGNPVSNWAHRVWPWLAAAMLLVAGAL